MSAFVSRRQELFEFAERGRLRDMANDAGLSDDAQNLLCDIVIRYCEPRRKPARGLLAGRFKERP